MKRILRILATALLLAWITVVASEQPKFEALISKLKEVDADAKKDAEIHDGERWHTIKQTLKDLGGTGDKRAIPVLLDWVNISPFTKSLRAFEDRFPATLALTKFGSGAKDDVVKAILADPSDQGPVNLTFYVSVLMGNAAAQTWIAEILERETDENRKAKFLQVQKYLNSAMKFGQ